MEKAIPTKKIDRSRRVFALALALLLCLSVVTAAAPSAAAASPLPQSNDEPRHTVCHAISAQAQAYYTGDYNQQHIIAALRR